MDIDDLDRLSCAIRSQFGDAASLVIWQRLREQEHQIPTVCTCSWCMKAEPACKSGRRR